MSKETSKMTVYPMEASPELQQWQEYKLQQHIGMLNTAVMLVRKWLQVVSIRNLSEMLNIVAKESENDVSSLLLHPTCVSFVPATYFNLFVDIGRRLRTKSHQVFELVEVGDTSYPTPGYDVLAALDGAFESAEKPHEVEVGCFFTYEDRDYGGYPFSKVGASFKGHLLDGTGTMLGDVSRKTLDMLCEGNETFLATTIVIFIVK